MANSASGSFLRGGRGTSPRVSVDLLGFRRLSLAVLALVELKRLDLLFLFFFLLLIFFVIFLNVIVIDWGSFLLNWHFTP